MNTNRRIMKSVSALLITVALTVCMIIPTFAAAKHTVTFMYGAKTYVATVDHGCSVIPPSDTYVPGYIFAGWVGNANDVTEDRIILGAYTKVDTPAPAPAPAPQPDNTPTYRVHFVDGLTGVEYYGQTVSKGSSANPPEVPHHDGYHFERYNGSYDNVDSERTVTVIYEPDWNYHYYPSDWWWYWDDLDNYGYYQDYWWM